MWTHVVSVVSGVADMWRAASTPQVRPVMWADVSQLRDRSIFRDWAERPRSNKDPMTVMTQKVARNVLLLTTATMSTAPTIQVLSFLVACPRIYLRPGPRVLFSQNSLWSPPAARRQPRCQAPSPRRLHGHSPQAAPTHVPAHHPLRPPRPFRESPPWHRRHRPLRLSRDQPPSRALVAVRHPRPRRRPQRPHLPHRPRLPCHPSSPGALRRAPSPHPGHKHPHPHLEACTHTCRQTRPSTASLSYYYTPYPPMAHHDSPRPPVLPGIVPLPHLSVHPHCRTPTRPAPSPPR
ncbi:hypothetical protein JB92DRAFT_1938104 [Gautieria morchelliformis]|nr:hypothetical protein JB92DRAFT_1938104 [Gautieria morchelliformis]